MTRKVVITGGSSGLGLALAHALVARGDAVALLARDERKLENAAAELRASKPGAIVHATAADVQDAAALAQTFATLANSLGGIDVLVNSAGIMREGYFEKVPLGAHREVMDINYFGTLNAIQAALPYLKKAARPRLQGAAQSRIVNIASMAGLTGVFGYTAYCAAKHALVGLSESLRYELAPQGITVQLVCPGEFDSPLVDALEKTRTPENREHTLTIPKVGVDVIVQTVLRGMDGNRFRIVPGRLAQLSAFGLQHFPGISRAVGDARVRKVYVGPR
jgi:3-dehydrosphinganine reductase